MKADPLTQALNNLRGVTSYVTEEHKADILIRIDRVEETLRKHYVLKDTE